jgi:hypothetical protein
MNEGRVRRSGPVAVLPHDEQVTVAYDSAGAVGFVYRRSYATHWDRPPLFMQRHVQCLAIHIPMGETRARVSSSRAVADPKVTLDTLLALGLSDQGPIEWQTIRRGSQIPAKTARRLRKLVDGLKVPRGQKPRAMDIKRQGVKTKPKAQTKAQCNPR